MSWSLRSRFVVPLAGLALATAVVPAQAAGGIAVGAPRSVPNTQQVESVSCPPGAPVSETVCGVALQPKRADSGLSLVTNGVPAAPHIEDPGGTFIACPTMTVCAMADFGTVQWIVGGKSQGVTSLGNMTGVDAIACESASLCVVTGHGNSAGQIAFVTPTDKSVQPTTVPGTTRLYGVSCDEASCVAVGAHGAIEVKGQGEVVAIHGTSIGTPRSVSGLYSVDTVSCGAPSRCLAIGNRFVGGAPRESFLNIVDGKPAGMVATSSWIQLSCWSGTDCLAAANGGSGSGMVAHVHLGQIVATHSAGSPKLLFGISCPAAGSCLVVGGQPQGKPVVLTVTA